MMEAALLLLSRLGWDQIGPGAFRRGDDEVVMSPAEVPFWAAQLERLALPTDRWEARRVFLDRGFVAGPRRTGITHTRRGETLYYFDFANAESAAQALNGTMEQRGLFDRPAQRGMEG